MSYSVTSEEIFDGNFVFEEKTVTLYRDDVVIFQFLQKGNVYYDFFKRGNEEWAVITSDEEISVKFYDIANRQMYVHLAPCKFRKVLVNPTGEYMMYNWGVRHNWIDFLNIRNVNECRHICFAPKWYEKEGLDSALYNYCDAQNRVEWISDYRLKYSNGIYEIIYDMTRDATCLNFEVDIEWREVTLFDILHKTLEI